MPDIFISYNREDQARARLFAEAFESEGLEVWWDATLRSGEAYDLVTEKALKEARAVVVLWSRRSVESRWVRAEATQADRNKTLLPVMIEPCERPIMFELTQTADLMHWQGARDDTAWLAFLDDLRRFMGEPERTFVAMPPAPVPRRPLIPVLAVLAFDNLSDDREMTFFSDGVSEEILLSVSRGIKSIGRASSFQLRGADKAVRNVAAVLGVTHVLDGTVRRVGGLVRISAQLIDTTSQITVWQGRYDRPARDLFAVQEEIAISVASALDCKLAPMPQTGEIDPETYEQLQRLIQTGVSNQQTALRARIDAADAIIRRAPMFGRGWIEAARMRATMRRNASISREESRQLYEEIQPLLKRAEQLLGSEDPLLTALVVNWTPWAGAWSVCERRLREALERMPQVAVLRGTLGSLLMHSGRLSDALDIFQDISRLEPLQSGPALGQVLCLLALERGDEAYALGESICRRWPDNSFGWRVLVTSAARDGRWEVVEHWTASAQLARYQREPKLVEQVLAAAEMSRSPEDSRRGEPLQRLADIVAETGRCRLLDIVDASEFCDLDSVYYLVDSADFSHLADPLEGYEPSDLGAQVLFHAAGKRLRSDRRFVRLCARLGLAVYWVETGRWPDCADQVDYDFRAEARRLVETPLG